MKNSYQNLVGVFLYSKFSEFHQTDL